MSNFDRRIGKRAQVFALLVGAWSATDARAGCPCQEDINNNGATNVIDAAIVMDCIHDNCANCTNSCDVDCDGDVDYVDFGRAWCRFEGGGPNCCTDPTGACSI